jgi:hypothetical protein
MPDRTFDKEEVRRLLDKEEARRKYMRKYMREYMRERRARRGDSDSWVKRKLDELERKLTPPCDDAV